MKTIGIIFILLLIPLGCYAEKKGKPQTDEVFVDAKEWSAFANNPTQENYFALGKLLANCKKGNSQCAEKLHPHSSNSEKFIDLALKGNKRAVDITFASLRFLGGGELEDAMRALGSIVESDPELFFRKVRTHGIPSIAMEGIVVMTPLELVDQFDLQLRVLRKRLKIVSSLQTDDPFLASYHDKAIKRIQSEINFRK